MRLHPCFVLCLSLASLSSLTAGAADDPFLPARLTPSFSDFGGTGLMQMPTGRNAAEGEFNIGMTFSPEYYHYSVAVQLFPWLEGTARYTLVQDLLYSDDPSFSREKYTDKGFDVKLRLLEEGFWLPETSVGLRDIGGTGLFDAEYLAATKALGPLDVTLGMGWGYIGQRGNVKNPFCSVRDSFCERSGDYQDRGGSIDYQRWFKGPASLIGGLEYQTPWQPLRLKLEYDGNDYSQDFPVVRAGVDMAPSTPINAGIVYSPWSWGDFRLSYERGTTWVLGFNLRTNYNNAEPPYRSRASLRHQPAPAAATLDEVNWPQLSQALEQRAGLYDAKLVSSGNEVEVIADQKRYRDRHEAYQQAAQVMAEQLPAEVSHYRITEQRERLEGASVVIDAQAYQRVAEHRDIDADVLDAARIEEPPATRGTTMHNSQQPLSSYLAPQLQQSVGGSESFYMYSLGLNGGVDYQLNDNWQFGGALYLNLADNFDKFLYLTPPDGTGELVPRVRTLARQYIHDTPLRLQNLQLTWMDQFSNGWYAQSYAGYLELMFAGGGGELLYRPLQSSWAIGVDGNYVIQRDPNSYGGLFDEKYHIDDLGRSYMVITGGFTGHLSLYYQPQWQWLGLNTTRWRLGGGQYLAGDRGFTLEFSKKFTSGMIVGAQVTKTDLSAEEYGEGSFNKGFYISIPFDLMTANPTTRRGSLAWSPLTRDGGQALSRKHQLIGLSESRSLSNQPFGR